MASIRKRNKSYLITVSCGYDIYGKKIVETSTYTPDPILSPKRQEKAVQDYAHEFERRVKCGFAMDGRKHTLKEFSEQWLESYVKPSLQPGTVQKYTEELDDKILPALGHYKLTELRPSIIARFYASLMAEGARKDGKPGGYSIGSIRKTSTVLSSVLRTATEWELIDQNPCQKATLPAAPYTPEKSNFFTPAQTIAFLSYIEQPLTWTTSAHTRIDDTGKSYQVGAYTSHKMVSPQLQVLFNLVVYTGMRRGELLALKWDDVDFDNNLIRISKSLSVVKKEIIIKYPKSTKSIRTVSIPSAMTEKLRKLHTLQSEFISKVGDYWQGENYIFTQETGKPMYPSTPLNSLKTIIKNYNEQNPDKDPLPDITFHGLRHTSATLLISGKQDIKTVSARLGHAQTSTTLNIYAHPLQENEYTACAALEAILTAQKAE